MGQVFTIRVKDQQLFEAVHREATAHGQSVNNFIVDCLRARLSGALDVPARYELPPAEKSVGMAKRRNARVLYDGPPRHCDRCGTEITQRDRESLTAYMERRHCGRACSEMAPDYVSPETIEAEKRRIRRERGDWIEPELRDVE